MRRPVLLESLLLTKHGTGVEAEYQQVLTGLVQTQLTLAEHAQRRGEFDQADLHANVVLKEDPKTRPRLPSRRRTHAFALDVRLDAQPGHNCPLPEAHNDRVTASTHVQNGKVLFEAGKFDEAEAQLNQAIKIDPSNTAAYTYVNIIREQRHKQENASAKVGPRNACSKSTAPGMILQKRDALPFTQSAPGQ